jgi:hypothetical protein
MIRHAAAQGTDDTLAAAFRSTARAIQPQRRVLLLQVASPNQRPNRYDYQKSATDEQEPIHSTVLTWPLRAVACFARMSGML